MIFTKLLSFFNTNSKQLNRFENIINLAKEIREDNPYGLISLIRLIGQPLQTRAIISVAQNNIHMARPPYTFDNLFFDPYFPITKDGKSAYDLFTYSQDMHQVKLGTDTVLAVPWHRDRFISTLSFIGSGKDKRPWKYDSTNHDVDFLLPIGIAIVNGGNHSIAAGIIDRDGVFEARQTTDISGLYNHIYYNGIAFVRKFDNKILSKPEDEEIGTIFEIGRLMALSGISYCASNLNAQKLNHIL